MQNKFDQHKYLEEKCKLYFDKTISNWIDELNLTTEIKNKIRNLSDVDKARFAWYCVAFEIYFKITDSEKTKNFFKKSIIDAHFNDVFYGKPAKDFGVDAVHIEDNTIHLFNFKYKEDGSGGQKENELLASYNFLSVIKNNSLKEITNHAPRKKINEIGDMIKNRPMKIILHMVTNETKELADSPTKKNLATDFGIEINSVTAGEIFSRILEGADTTANNAKIFLDSKDLFISRDNKHTTIIAKISILDLIRISSLDDLLRNTPYEFDEKKILDCQFNTNLLGKNIRGWIKSSSFNQKVIKSFDKEYKNFFLYNNGITILSDFMSINNHNLNTKKEIGLINFQIVNGGQTLRNLYQIIESAERDTNEKVNRLINKLKYSFVLVRFLTTDINNTLLKDKIAEYTNSQTSISKAQLRAFDEQQIIIKDALDKENILYKLKDGEFSDDYDDKYIIVTKMHELAQILYSIQGNATRAASRVKDLLEDDGTYNNIFKNSDRDFNKYGNYIKYYSYIFDYWLKYVNENFIQDGIRRDSKEKLAQNISLYMMYFLNIKNGLDEAFDTNNENFIGLKNEFQEAIINCLDNRLTNLGERKIEFKEINIPNANKLFTSSDFFDQVMKELNIKPRK